MVNSKVKAEANRARRLEYEGYRAILTGIANNQDAIDNDRIHAIELIMTLDREGVPPKYTY